MRFPCLQTSSGAQNTGDRAQARRKAPGVPEQAISLRDDACTMRGMSTQSRFRGGNGDCPRPVRKWEWDFYLVVPAPISSS
jgi:hypothetical protein